MTRRGAVALAVVVLAVAAGCGDDGDDGAAQRGASTTSTRSATSETTTTSSPGPACTELDEPAGREMASAPGDVDGDRRADELISYRDAAGAWHLHVALAVGGGADLLVPTVGDASVQVLGGADVDGDGTDELWARTGAGASAAIVGLARLVDCSLVQVTFAGGEPAEFAVGGTVGTAAGLRCHAGPGASVLTSYTATHTGDDRYEVTSLEWIIDGPTLVAGPTATTTVVVTDPLMAWASSFSCGALAL